MKYWSEKKVLVAGGTGLLGIPLVNLLLGLGAKVRIVSLDHPSRANHEAEFIRADLTNYQNCLSVCQDMDYVFNLLCVKGSPDATKKNPVQFFEPMMRFNINLASAAYKNEVRGYLFVSSVAVYKPAEILYENDVWTTLPSSNDWFAGWAKRMGELQLEAYKIQYNWNIAIVRPSNVYGPYDNFDPATSLFMASIIRKFAEKQNPIVVWGDGSQIRDFIHAKDAAQGIILAAEKATSPVNLCSGNPTTIKKVVEILASNADYKPEIIYDATKPAGDKKRILDVSQLKGLGFEPVIDLEVGIAETIKWYVENPDSNSKQYNIFK